MRSLLEQVPDLPRELARLLSQIPAGRVTTYGDLARTLGDQRAARWVGESLVDHPHGPDCPCHRVVRVNGDVGLFITRNVAEKIALLQREGVTVAEGRVDLGRFRTVDFHPAAPLAALRKLQAEVADDLSLQPLPQPPKHVGGVDVSYVSRTEAVASFVLVERNSLELVWSTSVQAGVTFPYLSGYLSFRELPILARLFEQVRAAGREPDVTLVDGNGILHPRRAGSASCFGLVAGTPTIGVGKTLLCGRVDHEVAGFPNVRSIVHNHEQVGYAVQANATSRPVYVSPGHLTDLQSALQVTRMMLTSRGRLPVPISLADRISRQAAERVKRGMPLDVPCAGRENQN